MAISIIATVAYGLLSSLGGIWGYVKSSSKPSLISSLISGVLLIITGNYAVARLQSSSIG